MRDVLSPVRLTYGRFKILRDDGGHAAEEGSTGMSKDEDGWEARGKCRTGDPELLFVEGAAQNRAKAVCAGCPVRTECLAHALDHRIEYGVWGGLTERERRSLLRRRPTVTSWRNLLETARAAHEAPARPDRDTDVPRTG